MKINTDTNDNYPQISAADQRREEERISFEANSRQKVEEFQSILISLDNYASEIDIAEITLNDLWNIEAICDYMKNKLIEIQEKAEDQVAYLEG